MNRSSEACQYGHQSASIDRQFRVVNAASPIPEEEVGEEFTLFNSVVQGVVRVFALREERGRHTGLSGFANWNPRLCRVHRFDVESCREVKRGTERREPHEVPIQEHPIKPEGIRDENWLRRARDLSNPRRCFGHCDGRLRAALQQLGSVEPRHFERLFVEPVADWLEFAIERSAIRVFSCENRVVETRGDRKSK